MAWFVSRFLFCVLLRLIAVLFLVTYSFWICFYFFFDIFMYFYNRWTVYNSRVSSGWVVEVFALDEHLKKWRMKNGELKMKNFEAWEDVELDFSRSNRVNKWKGFGSTGSIFRCFVTKRSFQNRNQSSYRIIEVFLLWKWFCNCSYNCSGLASCLPTCWI